MAVDRPFGPPTAADFDKEFATAARSEGVRRVWRTACPGVEVESRAEWHERFTQVFRVALELGDPGDDAGLASAQQEARQALPLAHLVDRVVVTAAAAAG